MRGLAELRLLPLGRAGQPAARWRRDLAAILPGRLEPGAAEALGQRGDRLALVEVAGRDGILAGFPQVGLLLDEPRRRRC